MASEKLKEKVKRKIAEYKQKRKNVEGKPNIEGVTTPKKRKPKKQKEEKRRKHTPGMVSIGAHGGRYVQEPSGHKRYVSEGQLSGVKRFKKSSDVVKSILEDVTKQIEIKEFVAKYKEKKHE
jgi:hypothetical protein